MREQLISLETAKLIPNPKKDTAWNECPWFYIDTTTTKGYFMATRNDLDVDYPRPTQSLLQKWLREVHLIDVIVLKPVGYVCFLYWGNYKSKSLGEKSLATYEDVLEQGLLAALQQIKKKR